MFYELLLHTLMSVIIWVCLCVLTLAFFKFRKTRGRVVSFFKLRGLKPPEGFRVEWEWESDRYAVYSTRDGFKMGTCIHKKDLSSFWDRPNPKNEYFETINLLAG